MFIFSCEKLLPAHMAQLLSRQGLIPHKTARPQPLSPSALGLPRRSGDLAVVSLLCIAFIIIKKTMKHDAGDASFFFK